MSKRLVGWANIASKARSHGRATVLLGAAAAAAVPVAAAALVADEPLIAFLSLQSAAVFGALAVSGARSNEIARMTRNQIDESIADLAALQNLYAISDIRHEVPVPTGYAASPRTILRLVTLARDVPAGGLIVECGSGASTVWLAHAVRATGRGRVIALEHDAHYAALTRAALDRNGLSEFAEVRTAPLEQLLIGEHTYTWYAAEAYAGLSGIHVLFVDGPPASIGPRSRYPAYPMLGKSLAPGAVVVLDDADRKDEQSIYRQWLAQPVDGAVLQDAGTVSRSRLLRVCQ